MASIRWPSRDVDPTPLREPLTFYFSNRVAKNRFMKASMTERMSSWSTTDVQARGIPSKELINVYKRWGEGGYGIILTGNILIDPEHLEAPGNPIISRTAPFEGDRFEAFSALAKAARAHGSLCIGQVNHPGRQVQDRLQPHPISASDVRLDPKGGFMGMTFGKPRAMTQEDINELIDGFAHTAEFLERAGYDGMQLHCAHGYLLAQFISPTTNRRTDKYGGSIENRARILVEIAAETRQRTKKDFSISIKLNSVEFQESGFQPVEASQLCAILEENGFDFVELSGGTYEKLAFDDSLYKRETTQRREAFFMEFADKIVPALQGNTKVYVTGGFKTAGAMVDALATVDGVGLARPTTQEPRLPADILSGKVKGSLKWPFPEDGFFTQLVASGTLIEQIGRDQEPVDLSQQDNADAFVKDMGVWLQKMGADSEMKLQGYVDVTSLPVMPYGTAAAPLG